MQNSIHYSWIALEFYITIRNAISAKSCYKNTCLLSPI